MSAIFEVAFGCCDAIGVEHAMQRRLIGSRRLSRLFGFGRRNRHRGAAHESVDVTCFPSVDAVVGDKYIVGYRIDRDATDAAETFVRSFGHAEFGQHTAVFVVDRYGIVFEGAGVYRFGEVHIVIGAIDSQMQRVAFLVFRCLSAAAPVQPIAIFLLGKSSCCTSRLVGNRVRRQFDRPRGFEGAPAGIEPETVEVPLAVDPHVAHFRIAERLLGQVHMCLFECGRIEFMQFGLTVSVGEGEEFAVRSVGVAATTEGFIWNSGSGSPFELNPNAPR